MEGAERGEAPPAVQAPDNLREAASNYAKQAWEGHESHDKHAHWAHWTRLALGVLGVVAGVLAGGSALADKDTTVVASAAFISAIIVGLQTFLNPGKNAEDNWRRAAGLATVSRKWQRMASAAEEPTREEFNRLLEEWEKLETP